MASFLDRLYARIARGMTPPPAQPPAQRSSIDTWLTQYLIPSVESGTFGYGGNRYPFGLQTTYAGQQVQEISATLPGYMAALNTSPPAFAAQMVRAMVLSQARFTFRNLPWHPRTPRRLFSTPALEVLATPWPNATTGELIARMEWHAGLAGNAYVARQPTRLRVLRPDWCGLMYGSDREPDDPAHALDGELLGLVYQNGGIGRSGYDPQVLLPDEFAHWSPVPDPLGADIGMSWVTPALRDIQGDKLATSHKLQFFAQGATPNLVVKGIQGPPGQPLTPDQFNDLVDMMENRHAGVANAYRTLYLTAGADATVVGSDLAQIDFKATQGAGENRIAVLSRVHPTILAIAEGLAGSSLNAGNFGMARRIWGDTWIHPTLQDLAKTLAKLVRVPPDAQLWFDTADIPILREDAKDAADIEFVKAQTIRQLVDGGFDPQSVVAAVQGQDVNLLKHSGLVSVQLNPPGAEQSNGQSPVEVP